MLYKTCTAAAAFGTKVGRGVQGLAPAWTHGCAGPSQTPHVYVNVAVCVYTRRQRRCTSLSALSPTTPDFKSLARRPATGRPGALHGNRGGDIFKISVPNFLSLAIVCYHHTHNPSHAATQKPRSTTAKSSATVP